MTEARRRDQWDHTAALLAAQAEVNRDRKKRPKPFTPDDFHPLPDPRRKRRRPAEKGDISMLKVFLPKHKRRPKPKE